MTTELKILTDEQIEHLAVNYECHAHGQFKNFARAIEQAILQSPEMQKLRKDAGRIEWYFGSADKRGWMVEYTKGCREGWSVEQWRASIDAAMEKEE